MQSTCKLLFFSRRYILSSAPSSFNQPDKKEYLCICRIQITSQCHNKPYTPTRWRLICRQSLSASFYIVKATCKLASIHHGLDGDSFTRANNMPIHHHYPGSMPSSQMYKNNISSCLSAMAYPSRCPQVPDALSSPYSAPGNEFSTTSQPSNQHQSKHGHCQLVKPATRPPAILLLIRKFKFKFKFTTACAAILPTSHSFPKIYTTARCRCSQPTRHQERFHRQDVEGHVTKRAGGRMEEIPDHRPRGVGIFS